MSLPINQPEVYRSEHLPFLNPTQTITPDPEKANMSNRAANLGTILLAGMSLAQFAKEFTQNGPKLQESLTCMVVFGVASYLSVRFQNEENEKAQEARILNRLKEERRNWIDGMPPELWEALNNLKNI